MYAYYAPHFLARGVALRLLKHPSAHTFKRGTARDILQMGFGHCSGLSGVHTYCYFPSVVERLLRFKTYICQGCRDARLVQVLCYRSVHIACGVKRLDSVKSSTLRATA